LGAKIGSSGFGRREKYCHNGGMAFAHHHDEPRRLPSRGVAIGSMAPVVVPTKQSFCRERGLGSGIRAWARLPYAAAAAQGHGLNRAADK
jgi:hypothetical protein